MLVILDSLLSFILLYKYLGLFLVSYLAAVLLPLPSSSLLAAAGAFSAQGYFSLSAVLVVAFFGNFLGDATGYIVARIYGVKVLKRLGFKRIIESSLYGKLELYIQTFSFSIIFFSRFLTGVGPLVNILSGLSKARYRVFFVPEVLGEISYVLVYGLVGYFLGSEWENNIGFLFEATFVIITLGLTISLIQYGILNRVRKSSSS